MQERTARRLTPQARRRQIVEATLDTIAAVGVRQATFARIAERSGLSSTRLISYHFDGRDELLNACVVDVYTALAEHLAERLSDVTDPPAELAAYIRAIVEFVDGHRIQMQAMFAIFIGFRDEAGESRSYDADTDDSALGRIEAVLRRGQEDGHFRAFDTFVMASLVQRSVDGLPFLLQTRPDLDVDAYADELVETFTIATRADRAGTDGVAG